LIKKKTKQNKTKQNKTKQNKTKHKQKQKGRLRAQADIFKVTRRIYLQLQDTKIIQQIN